MIMKRSNKSAFYASTSTTKWGKGASTREAALLRESYFVGSSLKTGKSATLYSFSVNFVDPSTIVRRADAATLHRVWSDRTTRLSSLSSEERKESVDKLFTMLRHVAEHLLSYESVGSSSDVTTHEVTRKNKHSVIVDGTVYKLESIKRYTSSSYDFMRG